MVLLSAEEETQIFFVKLSSGMKRSLSRDVALLHGPHFLVACCQLLSWRLVHSWPTGCCQLSLDACCYGAGVPCQDSQDACCHVSDVPANIDRWRIFHVVTSSIESSFFISRKIYLLKPPTPLPFSAISSSPLPHRHVWVFWGFKSSFIIIKKSPN